MEALKERQEVLAPDFIVSALGDNKELPLRLVRLSNVLSKEEESAEVLALELESTAQVLIRPELLEHESATVRIIVGLCLTNLFVKIGFHEVVNEKNSTQMDGVFQLLLKCISLVEKQNQIGNHAKNILERIATDRLMLPWASSSKYMRLLQDTFFGLMTKHVEKVVAVHMSQIMIDCLASTTPVSQESIEYLLSKLCWVEETGGDESEVIQEELSDSDSEEMMMHTQEAPEEKKRRAERRQTQESLDALKQAELLACDVLKGAARVIEPAIPLVLHGELESEKHLFSTFLPVLVEKLCRLHPPFVNRVLPEMIDRVSDGRVEVGQQSVEALITVFLTPYYTQGCLSFAHLFIPFLGRMKDNEQRIRLSMIDFAAQYLLTGAPQQGLDMVAVALKERLGDRDARVRTAALEAYKQVIVEVNGLERVDAAAVQEITQRALDKVDSVRFLAAQTLGFIFRKSIEKLLQALEDVAETKLPPSRSSSSLSNGATAKSSHSAHETTMGQEAEHRLKFWSQRFKESYAAIPSRIIERYVSKELTFEERAYIDNFISEDWLHYACEAILLHKRNLDQFLEQQSASSAATSSSSKSKKGNSQNQKSTETTMDAVALGRHITLMVSSLADPARRVFLKWLEEKKSIRDEIRTALASSDSVFRASFLDAFEKRTGKVGKVELNATIKEHLAALVNPRSMEKRVQSTAAAIGRSIKKASVHHTMTQLINKLYLKFFSTGIAQEWISHLSRLSSGSQRNTTQSGGVAAAAADQVTNDIYTPLCGKYPSVDAQLTTTVDLLLRSVAIHPGYLGTLLKDLDTLLKTSKDARVTQAVARISSYTAHLTVDAKDGDAMQKDQIRSLQKVAEGGDSRTAAEAGAALMAHFAANDEATDEADSFIDAQLKIVRGPMNDRVAAALAALTPLVKLFTSEQALPLIDRIVDIVRDAFAAKPKTTLTNKNKTAPASFATPVTCAAVEGLQFAVSWFKNLAAISTANAASPNAKLQGGKKSAPSSPFTKSKTPSKATPKGKKSASKELPPISPNRPAFKLSKSQNSSMTELTGVIRELLEADHNDLDHVWLRATAITGMLRLAETRTYDDLFGLESYLRLSEIIMDDEVPSLISSEIRSTLIPSLMAVHRLPLKYLPLAVLLVDDRPQLAQLIEQRRNWLKTKMAAQMGTGASDEQLARAMAIGLPENALPWLIFILAHSSYLETDAPKYKRTWEYLHFFLSAILQAANFDFIYQMLEDIRQLDDALDPDSHLIHMVAELGLRVIADLRSSDSKLQRLDGNTALDPRKVYLPAALFKARYHKDENGKEAISLASTLPSYLPDGYVPPFKKTSSLLAPATSSAAPSDTRTKGKGKSRAKRASTRMEVDDGSESGSISEESDDDMAFSSDEEARAGKNGQSKKKSQTAASKTKGRVSTPSKTPKTTSAAAKRTTPSRKVKATSYMDQFEESSESDSDSLSDSPPPRAKREAPTPSSAKKGGKKSASVERDEESDPETSPPPAKRPKRASAAASSAKSTPSATPVSRSAKKRALEEVESAESSNDEEMTEPSPKRPKRSGAMTPASNKPKASPIREKLVEEPHPEASSSKPAEAPKRATRASAAQASGSPSPAPAKASRSANAKSIGAKKTSK